MSSTIRVHELAKELGVSTKEVLEKLEKIGIPVKSHMSSLETYQADRVRNFYRPVQMIEERITPGIIRRRIKAEAPPSPPKLEPEAPAQVARKARPRKKEVVPPPPEEPVVTPMAEELPEPQPAPPSEPISEVIEEVETPTPVGVGEVGLRELRHEGEPRGRQRMRQDEGLERRERVYRPTPPAFKPKRPSSIVPLIPPKKPEITIPKAIKRVIKIVDTISVGELAKRMGVKVSEVIKRLMSLGLMATINQALDLDTAALVAQEFGYEVENVAFEPEMILGEEEEEAPEDRLSRPPVVTVMGHVDHGKTSLLDAIRKTNVAAQEMGGITQHIGAYQVKLDKGVVTFIDTPGHEAFTAMRARGAKVTDLVVLVVAADDGVMPQTVEAIDHARAANVPMIVAINKIDKANADPHKVRQQLNEMGLVPEEWGGDMVCVEVSAKKGIGIRELLEYILLQAELLELKANSKRRGRGTIVEAKLDKGRGPVATVLVQEGTIRVGDPFICGTHFGKVRAMINDLGQRVLSATPSMPVEIVGISGVPEAGDILRVVDDERKAREVSLYLRQKERERELIAPVRLTLEELYSRAQAGEVKELNLIIKADVQGAVEALKEALLKLETRVIKLKVLHSSVGAITESDVMLAKASGAIIIGFNVKPEARVEALAEQHGVDVRTYQVIYDAVSEVRRAMEGLLEPTLREVYLGRAEVRQTFQISRLGTVAGSYVADGRIVRGARARLMRNGAIVYEGTISSLKRFKDDVKEVNLGFECGIGLENFNDIKEGDMIEAYEIEKVPTKLE